MTIQCSQLLTFQYACDHKFFISMGLPPPPTQTISTSSRAKNGFFVLLSRHNGIKHLCYHIMGALAVTAPLYAGNAPRLRIIYALSTPPQTGFYGWHPIRFSAVGVCPFGLCSPGNPPGKFHVVRKQILNDRQNRYPVQSSSRRGKERDTDNVCSHASHPASY